MGEGIKGWDMFIRQPNQFRGVAAHFRKGREIGTMNKKTLRIAGWALSLSMAVAGIGAAVGTAYARIDSAPTMVRAVPATSTLTFEAKCNGSGTADDGASWTVTSDGTESNFDNTKGIHYGTGKAAVKYINLTTSGISGTITRVVVNASGASGVSATAGVTVGGNAFGGNTQSIGTTATNYTFDGSATGEIVVTVTKPASATGALYVKSIAVTYESGPATLSSPTNISYNSLTQRVTWNVVDHASGYKFSSDGGANYSDAPENYYDVSGLANGDYSVKIYAVGDGGTNYNDSEVASFSLTKSATPTYDGVSIVSGSLAGLYKGDATVTCTATVTGDNNPSQIVTWYITADNVYDTTTEVSGLASINANGIITFEDNGTVYVWALAANGATHNASGVAVTASNLIDPPGSEANPYTVAQARAAIDAGTGINDVYAIGYVSEIVTEYSAQHSNITFNIVDTLGDSTFLQAYRAVGDDAVSIKVGGRVIVRGTLTKYSSTYEFAQGGNIVSWTNPELESISISGYKTSFETGDAFDFGGTVTATYVGGGEEDVTNKATFTGYNMSSASVQTVTVTYTENEIIKTAQYDITVTVPVTKYTVTFVAGTGATGTMDPESIAENTEYELPDCDFTAPDGKQFDCWSVVVGTAEAVEKQPGDSITITAATTVTAVWETIPTVTYRKVTTNLDDFSGDYLVVYETGSVAFDGSLTTLDASSNNVSVSISSNAISALEKHEFHIAAKTNGYSIKSASGMYIGKTADSNGLNSNASDNFTNTIAYSSGIQITSESKAVLRYNSSSGQERFRFFSSGTYTNQKAIDLYLQVTEIDEFIETLKMTQYTDDFEYEKDRCDANYGAAKAAFNALAPAQRAYFIAEGGKNGLYEDEYERLINWASAHYETIGTDDNSGDKNVLKKAVSIPAFAPNVSESSPLPIVIVVTFTSMAALGGFVALKRRKSVQ